jgi:toxin HigB-1
MSIQSFRDPEILRFFQTGYLKKGPGWANLKDIARRKLDMLEYSASLRDLKAPPGNKLEALKGDLIGFYCIRINDRWRIVFKWTLAGPSDVDIIDYH